MNNEERRDHAADAFTAYLRSKGEPVSDNPETDDYELSDLICDLLHLSDHLGYDPQTQIDRALTHYHGEKHDEGRAEQ